MESYRGSGVLKGLLTAAVLTAAAAGCKDSRKPVYFPPVQNTFGEDEAAAMEYVEGILTGLGYQVEFMKEMQFTDFSQVPPGTRAVNFDVYGYHPAGKEIYWEHDLHDEDAGLYGDGLLPEDELAMDEWKLRDLKPPLERSGPDSTKTEIEELILEAHNSW